MQRHGYQQFLPQMNGHNLGKFEIKGAIFDLRVEDYPNPTNWY